MYVVIAGTVLRFDLLANFLSNIMFYYLHSFIIFNLMFKKHVFVVYVLLISVLIVSFMKGCNVLSI